MATSAPAPRRAPELEALFPDVQVAVFLTDVLLHDVELSDDERGFIERAVPGRRAEFATGRACARAAIEELGRSAPSIPVGERRQPEWPEGVTGAITHTRREGRQFVAAVAALDPAGDIGVGIDAEVIQPLKNGVRDMLLVPAEIAMVDATEPSEHETGNIRVFSAKEAFYKAQFALTGSWVGFSDMQLTSLSGTGDLIETGAMDALEGIELPAAFRQTVADGLVISGVVVRRRPS